MKHFAAVILIILVASYMFYSWLFFWLHIKLRPVAILLIAFFILYGFYLFFAHIVANTQ